MNDLRVYALVMSMLTACAPPPPSPAPHQSEHEARVMLADAYLAATTTTDGERYLRIVGGPGKFTYFARAITDSVRTNRWRLVYVGQPDPTGDEGPITRVSPGTRKRPPGEIVSWPPYTLSFTTVDYTGDPATWGRATRHIWCDQSPIDLRAVLHDAERGVIEAPVLDLEWWEP